MRAVLLCSLQLSSSHLPLECSFKAKQVPVSSDNVALLLHEAISTFEGTSLSDTLAYLLFWCWWWTRGDGIGSVSSHGRGVSMSHGTPGNPPSLGEGGGRCLWKVFSLGTLGYKKLLSSVRRLQVLIEKILSDLKIFHGFGSNEVP